MAPAGFGKKPVPGQPPLAPDTYAHLPAREAYFAHLIDRLPEGAAMDIKTLAKTTTYGQQAAGSALNYLKGEGHLFIKTETLGKGCTMWVTRTYWSRVPHSEAWWEAFIGGGADAVAAEAVVEAPVVLPDEVRETVDVPRQPMPEPEPMPEPRVHPYGRPTPAPKRPSRAYTALAALGLADPRMTLSAADCAELEPLAQEWFARNVTEQQFTAAITGGLPHDGVHSPLGLARRRLTTKLPPLLARSPEPATPPARRRLIECTNCGRPGAPEAFHNGLCRTCRGGGTPTTWGNTATADTVHTHAARIRRDMRDNKARDEKAEVRHTERR
ncbi:MarR family transcriptional regulator [Streptomyces gamaensis]|uniref:MarR family transcriptional regulator n=1 Tax=Streptomyces gamaensis TaxID=1763542 RepID=A0ABW0YTB1_9ACTN